VTQCCFHVDGPGDLYTATCVPLGQACAGEATPFSCVSELNCPGSTACCFANGASCRPACDPGGDDPSVQLCKDSAACPSGQTCQYAPVSLTLMSFNVGFCN
jgi:hypothetical protein